MRTILKKYKRDKGSRDISNASSAASSRPGTSHNPSDIALSSSSQDTPEPRSRSTTPSSQISRPTSPVNRVTSALLPPPRYGSPVLPTGANDRLRGTIEAPPPRPRTPTPTGRRHVVAPPSSSKRVNSRPLHVSKTSPPVYPNQISPADPNSWCDEACAKPQPNSSYTECVNCHRNWPFPVTTPGSRRKAVRVTPQKFCACENTIANSGGLYCDTCKLAILYGGT